MKNITQKLFCMMLSTIILCCPITRSAKPARMPRFHGKRLIAAAIRGNRQTISHYTPLGNRQRLDGQPIQRIFLPEVSMRTF